MQNSRVSGVGSPKSIAKDIGIILALMQIRCRATPCSGGNHKSSFCLGVIHNAVAALKKQQIDGKASKQANLVQEDPKTEIEDQDFFEEIEDQEEEFFDLNL